MDEDEEIEENIDKVARDSDFLPRQIIESEAKRSKSCQPSLPLQVKTRSSKKRSQKAFKGIMDLDKRHKYSYIALMELFQGPQEIDHYKRKLEMGNTYCNCTKQSMCFGKKNGSVRDHGQQLTMNLRKRNIECLYVICNALKRLELWEELEFIAIENNNPWLVG
ncbi:hypothetical protein H5410_027028 [Solanum commersonii]|uniref:Uncharacterized protein n=1 Tax=Solanum commersonii TaxID=4109 RepID=A0A9J5Z0L9_SOLCO|nr:hypothetical protein H5410_027028 [Solanum commersonii]